MAVWVNGGGKGDCLQLPSRRLWVKKETRMAVFRLARHRRRRCAATNPSSAGQWNDPVAVSNELVSRFTCRRCDPCQSATTKLLFWTAAVALLLLTSTTASAAKGTPPTTNQPTTTNQSISIFVLSTWLFVSSSQLGLIEVEFFISPMKNKFRRKNRAGRQTMRWTKRRKKDWRVSLEWVDL